MSITDREFEHAESPELDDYCAVHQCWYDEDQGCPECAIDEADLRADWKIDVN